METIVVIAIIAAAAAYTVRSLYKSAAAGKKSCGCADGCPISERCDPKSGQCVVNEGKEGGAAWRKKLQA